MARIHYYTFHENASTPSTGIDFNVDDISNTDNLGLEITGNATTCLIFFQAQMLPDGDWYDVAGIRVNDFFLSSSTTKVNEVWLFDLNSFRTFRVNIISVSGGTITIKGKISKTT